VTIDPLVLIAEVDRATARLLDTAHTLDVPAIAAPSLLPGWTRGHVLAHVARNADSLINLLTWARTGVETPQYASAQAREDGISAGAARSPQEHLDDLKASADRLADAYGAMPAHAWAATVSSRGGAPVRAASLVWGRLREVEVHHVDLDAGYRPADWPEAFTLRLLHELQASFATAPPVRLHATDLGREFAIGPTEADDVPEVSGVGSELAAWLIGRSDGAQLAVSPEGALPPVPTWR
jgi:maleylpyruvate isomerase